MRNIDREAGFTVSAVCRPEYSRGHNIRLKDFIDKQLHIDEERTPLNIVMKDMGSDEEVYEKLFGESVKKYNATKKRKRDKIENYYEKVLEDCRRGSSKDAKSDHSRKPFYEFIFYLGDSYNCRCPDDVARKVLTKFVEKALPKYFPNFIPTCVALHNDEYSIDSRTGKRTESAVHVHVTGVYVAHRLNAEEQKEADKIKIVMLKEAEEKAKKKGEEFDSKRWKQTVWKQYLVKRYGKYLEKGMDYQSSLSGGCGEMGFFAGTGEGTPQIQFEEAVRHKLMDFAEAYGLKIFRGKCDKHSHLSKELYVQKQNQEIKEVELKQKEKLLEMKELLLEDEKDKFGYTIDTLEERESNIVDKERELSKREEQVEIGNVENLNKSVDLIYKERRLEDKEEEQKSKAVSLDQRESNIAEKEKWNRERTRELNEREIKLSKGEEPYKEIEYAQIKKERELNELQFNLNEEKYKLANDKALFEVESKKQQEKYDEQTKELKDENKQLDKKKAEIKELSSNLEKQQKINDEQLKQIDAWKDIKEQTELAFEPIDMIADKLCYSPQTPLDFDAFKQRVKDFISNTFVALKKHYKKENKELEKQLYGYTYEGRNGETYYNFGASQLNEMFFNAPSSTFRNIADEMDANQCKNFRELTQKKLNVLTKMFQKACDIVLRVGRKFEHSYERYRSLSLLYICISRVFISGCATLHKL